jgi:hypothetical protein
VQSITSSGSDNDNNNNKQSRCTTITMMKIFFRQGGESYRNFANSIKSNCSLSISNCCLYRYALFRKASNLTDLLIGNLKVIESWIIEFAVYLKNEKKTSFADRNTHLSVIKKFYRMNDVILNWYKVSQYLGENNRVARDRAYTTKEVQDMLMKSDYRMRVVILLVASTRMRLGAILGISLCNLSKVENYNLYQITVYENTKYEYYCYCSPEYTQAIDSTTCQRFRHCTSYRSTKRLD